MENSADEISWEEGSQDTRGLILAEMASKEAHLREIIGQPAHSFYLGASILSRILHVTGFIVVGVLYINSDTYSALNVWPILSLGGFVEAIRANRRLSALVELEEITNDTKTLP